MWVWQRASQFRTWVIWSGKWLVFLVTQPKRARRGQAGLTGASAGRRGQDQQMWSQNPTSPHPQTQREDWSPEECTTDQWPGLNVAPRPTDAAGAADKIQLRMLSNSRDRKSTHDKGGRRCNSCLPEPNQRWKIQALQPCRILCWQRPTRDSKVATVTRQARSTWTWAYPWNHTHGRRSTKPLSLIQRRRHAAQEPLFPTQEGRAPERRRNRRTAATKRVTQTTSRCKLPPSSTFAGWERSVAQNQGP